MKSYREELWFHTQSRREYVNITSQVERVVQHSGIQEGLVLVNAMHITASVYVNDDEAGLLQDYERFLEQLVPHAADYNIISRAKSKGPSGNIRYNWPRRFWSESRSEERAYREYGSDERRRRSPKAPRPYGEAHLWTVASWLPRAHRPAILPRRASPRSQIWASQLYRVFPDGPLHSFFRFFLCSSSHTTVDRCLGDGFCDFRYDLFVKHAGENIFLAQC